MCIVYLLHLFTIRARHSQGRMEQPLQKKIEKKSNFRDSRWTVFNSGIARPRKWLQRSLIRRDDTLLQDYENRYRKNILNDTKEVLNHHDPTLLEYFDYVIQENQLNYPPRDWKEAKIMLETMIDYSGH